MRDMVRKRRLVIGAVDTALVPLKARLQGRFVDALSAHATTAWLELLGLRKHTDAEGAQEWAVRYNLTDSWILPLAWYRAGVHLVHPTLDWNSLQIIYPSPVHELRLMPIPEIESRAAFVDRVVRDAR